MTKGTMGWNFGDVLRLTPRTWPYAERLTDLKNFRVMILGPGRTPHQFTAIIIREGSQHGLQGNVYPDFNRGLFEPADD